MAMILGLDLGTQSLKGMLLDTEKGVVNIQSEGYPLDFPKLDWAQEDPENWWSALKAVLARMKREAPAAFASISVIGFSGQMHGMVPLDEKHSPVMPAVIWVDQRSKEQVRRIEASFSFEALAAKMHNHIFTGFGFPSLLWMKEEQPEQFARVDKICSPKDYLRLRLIGGEPETEVTDASSMTAFDFAGRCWNREVLNKFGLEPSLFPVPHESVELAGEVTAQAAAETGLAEGIKVVYGSGDTTAVAMGCGMYQEGTAISNIGTGGNFNCYSARDTYDPKLRMQEFCNAVNRSYLLCGAMLSGGLSLSWLKKQVVGIEDYDALNRAAKAVPPGSEGLIFLPYLGGERAPHMDFNATGSFFGLRHAHSQGHFCRSVMEGVVFALKDSQCIMEENGVSCNRIVASGGGAKSPLWLQIQADIFDREIVLTESEEEACLGACLIAGLGAGIFQDPGDACSQLVRIKDVHYEPIAQNVEIYRQRYGIYRELYPQLKELMRRNAEIEKGLL